MRGVSKRSAKLELIAALLGLVVAFAYGMNLIGTPLRLVHVLTIVPLSLAAGIAVGRAATSLRTSR